MGEAAEIVRGQGGVRDRAREDHRNDDVINFAYEQDFHSATASDPRARADGLPRWRWTVAEIEKMAVNGYFHEDERFELVGGEIVPMSPKGAPP